MPSTLVRYQPQLGCILKLRDLVILKNVNCTAEDAHKWVEMPHAIIKDVENAALSGLEGWIMLLTDKICLLGINIIEAGIEQFLTCK